MERPTKEELKALLETYAYEIREGCYNEWHSSGCRPAIDASDRETAATLSEINKLLDTLYAEVPPMPVREKMQPQPIWDDPQFVDGGWESQSSVMVNKLDMGGQPIQFVQLLTPPAHTSTAQPVCEDNIWYWEGEGGTE